MSPRQQDWVASPRHLLEGAPASSREPFSVSADHRKPLVAFVLLALAAAVLVGVGRAHADAGRLFEAAGGRTVHVRGAVPAPGASGGGAEASGLGPAFDALAAQEAPTALSQGRVAHVPNGKGKRARRAAPVSRDAVRRPFGASRAYAAAGDRGSAAERGHDRRSGKRSEVAAHAGGRTRACERSDSRDAGRAQRPAHKAEKSQQGARRAHDKARWGAERRGSWSSVTR